jgi:hypothetical protein
VNAIPEKWIEVLFTAMSSTYGARFADLWRGSKVEDIKRQWAVELAKLSAAQMRAGRETLTDLERVPTLPEFMAHCRRARAAVAASTALQLEHTPTVSPEEARANLRKMDAMLGSMLTRTEPTAEWAYRRLINGKEGLPFEITRVAQDAITSPAGKQVIADCQDLELKAKYQSMRQTIVDDYRMRGKPLWGTA